MTIAYRPAEIDDAPFVVSTWSRAFKESRSAGTIATEDWERVMHPQIQRILARPTVRTVVAYENTAPDFLYGYIAAEPERVDPVVHFVYVKEPYRRAGYARGLFATIGIDPTARFFFTHWTPVVAKLTMQRDQHGEMIPNGNKIPNAKHEPKFARYVNFTPRSKDTWKR